MCVLEYLYSKKFLANILAEPLVRRSRKLQGLPPEFPPTKEETEEVTMDQLVTIDPSVEGIPVVESREEYSYFENPSTSSPVLVQLPSSHDSTFHFPIEGHSGAQDWVFSPPSYDPVASKFVQLLLFGRHPWDRKFLNTTLLLYLMPPPT